jgi:IS1 family transposase
MNKLDARLRAYILHSLCEGMSQRSCERIFQVSQNTVAKLFEEAGDMAIAYLASMRDLTIAKVQADELHAFVAARSFNVDDMLVPNEEAGTVWTYLAVCAETKLIFAYHLGSQTLADATVFARKLAATLKRDDHSRFVVRPTIVTDGLHAYPEALERGFGADLNFGVLRKKYSKTDKNGNKVQGGRYEGAQRIAVKGEIAEADIHTGYVERQNLNVRMGVRRYGRKTNAFSKKMLNHERHLALWIMYHNLCWIPRPQRPHRAKGAPANPAWIKRLPAAMAAGLTDRLWTVEDLLFLTDAFVAERKSPAPDVDDQAEIIEVLKDETDVALAPSHYVYQSFHRRSAKVHTAGCTNCRDGQGKSGNGGGSDGKWLPFYCLSDAEAAAEALHPDRYSTCSMCIGERRWLDSGR